MTLEGEYYLGVNNELRKKVIVAILMTLEGEYYLIHFTAFVEHTESQSS